MAHPCEAETEIPPPSTPPPPLLSDFIPPPPLPSTSPLSPLFPSSSNTNTTTSNMMSSSRHHHHHSRKQLSVGGLSSSRSPTLEPPSPSFKSRTQQQRSSPVQSTDSSPKSPLSPTPLLQMPSGSSATTMIDDCYGPPLFSMDPPTTPPTVVAAAPQQAMMMSSLKMPSVGVNVGRRHRSSSAGAWDEAALPTPATLSSPSPSISPSPTSSASPSAYATPKASRRSHHHHSSKRNSLSIPSAQQATPQPPPFTATPGALLSSSGGGHRHHQPVNKPRHKSGTLKSLSVEEHACMSPLTTTSSASSSVCSSPSMITNSPPLLVVSTVISEAAKATTNPRTRDWLLMQQQKQQQQQQQFPMLDSIVLDPPVLAEYSDVYLTPQWPTTQPQEMMISTNTPLPVLIEAQNGSVPNMKHSVFTCQWKVPNPRAHCFLIHGLHEHSGRFETLIDTLVPAGVNVYALDLPGHGKSNGQRGFIQSFHKCCDMIIAWIFYSWSKTLNTTARATVAPSFIIGKLEGSLIELHLLPRLLAEQKNIQAAGRPVAPVIGAVFTSISAAPPKTTGFFSKLVTSISPSTPLVLEKAPSKPASPAMSPMMSPMLMTSSLNSRDSLCHTGRIRAKVAKDLFEAAQDVGSPMSLLPSSLKVLFLHGSADIACPVSVARDVFNHMPMHDKTFRMYENMTSWLYNEARGREVAQTVVHWILQQASSSSSLTSSVMSFKTNHFHANITRSDGPTLSPPTVNILSASAPPISPPI